MRALNLNLHPSDFILQLTLVRLPVLHGGGIVESVADVRADHDAVSIEAVEGGMVISARAGPCANLSFFEAEQGACGHTDSCCSTGSSEHVRWHKAVGNEFRNTEALRRGCMTVNDLQVPFFGCFDYMGRRVALVCPKSSINPRTLRTGPQEPSAARNMRGLTSPSLHFVMENVLSLPPCAVDVVGVAATGARLVRGAMHLTGCAPDAAFPYQVRVCALSFSVVPKRDTALNLVPTLVHPFSLPTNFRSSHTGHPTRDWPHRT